jgi:hypothetical protein
MRMLLHRFQGWSCASVTAITILLSGNLTAETNSETEATPKLIKVIPDGVYANENDYEYPLYEVTLVGENLDDKDLKIFLNDRELQPVLLDPESQVPPRKAVDAEKADVQKDESKPPPRAYRENATDGSELKVWINKNFYSGLVYMKVGKEITPDASFAPTAPATASPAPSPSMPRLRKSKEVPVVLAKIDQGPQQWLFRGGALLVALFVIALPVILVRKSLHGVARNSWLSAMFLDKETATYSLSTFQFYIWTAVSVMAYFYLAASRSIVQGVWEFIDIPKNLPGIVFISATTGAIAHFVTTQRGPKGAGEEHPSLADFVSSGGVISAERVQFFIWTIIGALVFLWLSVTQDPVSIQGLPTVPQGFLELMGISSFGYLAGKVARRPGPVINDISIGETGPIQKGQALTLTVRGRILSKEADFKITYKDTAKKGESEQEEQKIPLTPPRAPTIDAAEEDEQSKPEKTYKKVIIQVTDADPAWFHRGKLVISNPDGQSASWPLPGIPEITEIQSVLIPPPTTPPSSDPSSLKLTLLGINLAPTAKFSIDTKPAIDAQLPRSAIKVLQPDEVRPQQFAQKLELTISKPNPEWITAGEHKLTIVNPDLRSAEGKFKIEAAERKTGGT